MITVSTAVGTSGGKLWQGHENETRSPQLGNQRRAGLFRREAARSYPRSRMANHTVQRTGASRFAQRQIERHRRLALVADLCVRPHHMSRSIHTTTKDLKRERLF